MKSQDDTLVFTLQSSGKEEIRFSLKTCENRLFAEMRLWFRSRKAGCLLPSKKGFCIGARHLEGFLTGFSRLRDARDRILEQGGDRHPNKTFTRFA